MKRELAVSLRFERVSDVQNKIRVSAFDRENDAVDDGIERLLRETLRDDRVQEILQEAARATVRVRSTDDHIFGRVQAGELLSQRSSDLRFDGLRGKKSTS